MALYALLLTLPHIPSVQSFLAQKTEELLGNELNTEVRIGTINLGLLNRVIIDDVHIKDQQREELLSINRLSAKIDITDLLEGRITVSSAQLFGAQAQLYKKDSLSAPNFMFIADALKSTDTLSQTPLNIRINSLIIRNSSVTYDLRDAPETTGMLNPNHLKVSDLSAHIALKALTDDSLCLNIKRLSLNEHAGLQIEKLAFLLEASKKKARLTDFTLQLPHTQVNIPQFEATFNSERIRETLRLEGAFSEVRVTPADFAFLLPELQQFSFPIGIEAAFRGTLHHLDIPVLSLSTPHDELHLQARGWVGTVASSYVWNSKIDNLHISEGIIKQLQEQFKDIPLIANNLGHISISGFFNGNSKGNLACQSTIDSKVGSLKIQFEKAENNYFTSRLSTQDLHLGNLLDYEELGMLATQIDMEGVPQKVKIKGNIGQFDYKGYSYRDIALDASMAENLADGHIKIDDPNVSIDLQGLLDGSQKTKVVRLTGRVNNLSPKVLHLTDQWGNASLSAVIDADFTASNLNDAMGTVSVANLAFNDSTGCYRINKVNIQSGFEAKSHYLRIRGDMGEAELSGTFDWNTLPQSFMSYVANKLPSLPGLPADIAKIPGQNNFNIRVYLSDSKWLEKFFGIPLQLFSPLILQATVDDQERKIEMSGSMPHFAYDNSPYHQGAIYITSPTDSMRCKIILTKQMDNGENMDLSLTLTAADNNLATTFRWDNNGTDETLMNGELNAVGQLYSGINGQPEAHIHVLPSSVIVAGTDWQLEPSDILYATEHLAVDHFTIHHNQQHLIIDGSASKNPIDMLTIDLKEVEVAYILDLVNFTAVSFSGDASGKVYLADLFNKPALWANLDVDRFHFQDGRMGTLHAHAKWDAEREQINIDAIADDGPEAKTVIKGYVSPTHEYIDLGIQGDGTYIEFLQSFTNSFLDGATGHAYGNVRLVGPLGNMNLIGKLFVNGQATVTALGTTYTIIGDTVTLIPDDILLKNIRVQDRFGNNALLSGGIHHKHLTSMTFDLDVVTDNLLTYDFHDFGESTFYGTVFAQGRVDLQGRPGEVNINCNVTPLAGTTFTYNASSTDAVGNQEFITWRAVSKNGDTKVRGYEGARVRGYENAEIRENEESEDSPTDIRINFLVNTTPESEIRLLMDSKTNDYITLHGSGVINASFYNKGAFQMFGTYTVADGTYGITIQNIIKKNFTFREGGTLVFGGNPFDANLNLQAVYTVNGVSLSDLSIGNSFTNNTVRVNCLMNILGQAGAPRVEFDLDMPTVNSEEKQMIRSVIASEQEMNQQVLYLLGIGRFYTQGANNASAQQYDQTSLAMQSFLSGTVSTQINEVLSQVINSNDWNFGANISTGNEGWHNAEYEGLVSGRMLNNRLLINGQFGYRDNATQATPSFIGDFDIRYLLYPNGNLALKVYNQTNDRYFTRSSLNTQGIGLIMKKDFDGLGDLFRHKRK